MIARHDLLLAWRVSASALAIRPTCGRRSPRRREPQKCDVDHIQVRDADHMVAHAIKGSRTDCGRGGRSRRVASEAMAFSRTRRILSEAAASSVAWSGLPMEGRALSLDLGAH